MVPSGRAHLLLQLFEADALRGSVLIHDGQRRPAHQRHKAPAHLHHCALCPPDFGFVHTARQLLEQGSAQTELRFPPPCSRFQRRGSEGEFLPMGTLLAGSRNA